MCAESAESAQSPRAYAYPWPDALAGLGPRQVIAFTPCRDCAHDPPPEQAVVIGGQRLLVPGPTGTWVAYGDRPVCVRHARQRALRSAS